jgi:hypothetical protein
MLQTETKTKADRKKVGKAAGGQIYTVGMQTTGRIAGDTIGRQVES